MSLAASKIVMTRMTSEINVNLESTSATGPAEEEINL